ncbi:nSTAND3 domain-containing NTPase [Tenacibaculum litopenaei]|uniref:nSTAND3 domain-containing NTPase n=1 Tax=Tenacibaculum litopenaei TaxID=396016 RepID=UPI0038B69F01
MKTEEKEVNPRQYRQSDVKRLFAFSNNQCSKPDCTNRLIAEDGNTIIGKICHIEAAKKGGPRFNKGMSNDERRSYDNLILLCDEHHQMIDNKINEEEYDKTTLISWKKDHYKKFLNTDYSISEELIHDFIINTREFYNKIEALDGPHKPSLSENYISREIEAKCISELRKNKVLLLTGVSFCGKSELAKKISEHFYSEENYFYKRVINVRDASSFLESKDGKRICILEDPFGHTSQNEKSSELKLLRDLLLNLPENNFLIVTSRIEIVRSVFSQTDLKNCKLGEYSWIDLTKKDAVFLSEFWGKVSKIKRIRKENIYSVFNIIEGEKSIHIGQLAHLSNHEKLKTEIFTIDEIYYLAQIDIDEICKSFLSSDDDLWKLLVILGFGCNTVNGLSISDLDYIYSKEVYEISLKKEKEEGIGKYVFGTADDLVLPSYEKDYGNKEDIERGLEILESSGYVIFENNHYVFSHPHYKEIGKAIFRKLTRIKKNRIYNHIFNLLTTLNREVSFQCSNALDYIFERIEEEEHKKNILDFIYKVADQCIFPEVSDQSSLFLIKNYKNPLLDENKRRSIIYTLQSSSEERNIRFKEGVSFKWKNSPFKERYFVLLNKEEYNFIIQKLKNKKNLSSEEVWKSLISINKGLIGIDINLLEYAFKSNQIFIRNLCAYIYFSNLHSLQNSLLKDKILMDEHPSVILNSLKGFFQGMTKNSKKINKEITERFLYFFKNDDVFCIRSSNLMTNFDTDYAEDSIEWKKIERSKHNWLWKVWGEFFPYFLNVFPPSIKFSNTPRFSGMMFAAKDMICPEQAVNISKKMLKRLTEISKIRILDNWEMSLINFLINATLKKPKARSLVFNSFFEINLPTYLIGYNLKWAISRWEDLLDEEKEIILNILSSRRSDENWLRAIVINGNESLSQEIQKVIFGDEDFFNKNIEELVSVLRKEVLIDILTVYRGNDWAIQQIGGFSDNEIVKRIIFHIAENNLDIDYDECVKIFLREFINGISREVLEEYKERWKKIYENSADKNKLLNIVIEIVGRSSFCIYETKELFRIVIDYHLRNRSVDFLSQKLAEKHELLIYTSSDRDVFKALDIDKFLTKDYFKWMETQNNIFAYLTVIKDEELTEDNKVEVVELIMEEVGKEDIKLNIIFILISEIEKKEILNHDLMKKLKSIPNRIKEKQELYFKFIEEPKLENFNYFYNS